jgi:hypothetical protein
MKIGTILDQIDIGANEFMDSLFGGNVPETMSFPVKSIHFCRFKKFQLILITFFFKAIL